MAGRVAAANPSVPHRQGSAALLVSALLALTGCGSTVATSGGALGGAPGTAGLSGPAAGADGTGAVSTDATGVATGTTGGSAGTGAASSGATGGAAGSGGAGTGNVSGTSAAGPTATGGIAPGVTADTVYVGVTVPKNADQANAALGAAVKQGDQRREYDLVIKDFNDHRPAGTRRLVPVYYEYDANGTATTDELGQRACSTFTEDHKVFVAFGVLTDNERTCLAKAGVTVASDALKSGADDTVFRQYPNYFEMGSPSLDRDMVTQVQSLLRQKYFTPWDTTRGAPAAVGGTTKVGVLTFGMDAYRRMVSRTMLPALKRAGYPPEVVVLDEPQNNQDLGKLSAQVSAAVLKFRSDDVDHVMITDVGGVLTLLFMQNANSQHYQPRYGGNSNNGWQALYDTGALPKEQLNGAMGDGWDPVLELPPSQVTEKSAYVNDASRACLDRYRRNGIQFPDANSQGIGLLICNNVAFTGQRVVSLGQQLNRDAFRHAVEQLGAAYQPSGHLREAFGPTRHDGMSAYWDWQWDSACTCGKYVGGVRSF